MDVTRVEMNTQVGEEVGNGNFKWPINPSRALVCEGMGV